ncbi:MAG TPA: 1-deoxy-D-xylulose-5-phosphate reductoisomerase [Aquella sp.]|nr:1-deoxy-D-xylulose-5-phosphate reductoisomerase [Aquella sp.]
MSNYKNITILGSTGSIGCNTLEVIRLHPDKYKITALTAGGNLDKLFEQCVEFKPEYAVILDEEKSKVLADKLKLHNLSTKVLSKTSDLVVVATLEQVDIVMSAIVGSSGLLPTLAAIKAGKKVLLANKESLVAGGKIINQALNNCKAAKLIPVDSEHSAIFQSLPLNFSVTEINKIILTASGGPFRSFSKEQLCDVTPEQAIKHPNWCMGKKISVDSSTLMNKGLEVIEAYWLFGVGLDMIDVVVHPQSIIHSMVEYVDCSIVAQLGTADMKTPIAYALAYPQRIASGSKRLDFMAASTLTFEKPDYDKFPCLQLAFDALKAGGVAPAVLNAANEIAVSSFLEHRIKFYDINAIISRTMAAFAHHDYNSVEEIIDIDHQARMHALSMIK